ncbi:MAG: hypothetical protein ACI36W_00285 [Coriobacteriales bacterium]
MAFCFSHQTLLQMWIHASRVEARTRQQSALLAREGRGPLPMSSEAACSLLASERVSALPPLSCKKAAVLSAAKNLGAAEPFHLLAPMRGQRRVQGGYRCHSARVCEAPNLFIPVGEHALLGTPALCLLQMANILDELSWLVLAYEFCGSYVLDPKAPKGFMSRDPLTTADELQELANTLSENRGSGKVRKLVRYLADGSASPKETGIALALTLPRAMGGYGFTLPQLNHPVELSMQGRALYGCSHCKCDLFWPGVDVEYDSDEEHAGEQGGAHDSLRAAALAMEGVEVVHLYSKNLASLSAFDAAAMMVGAKIGEKPALAKTGKELQRWRVQSRLLGHHSHPF